MYQEWAHLTSECPVALQIKLMYEHALHRKHTKKRKYFYMTMFIILLCVILQQSADKCTHVVCMVPLTAITQLHLLIMKLRNN